jgi:ubiquinone/menaquinone biosynthesis C-methylase UbiE
MPTNNAAFVGSIPENYDRYLGPVLFEPYAADLAARVSVPKGASVLEVACGTGIVTRRLRDRLGPAVKLVATDLNEAMMSYAAQKFQPEDSIEWKQADATVLPFEDQSFDAVVCQFGVMFFPDKAAAAREAYRVLKPGGMFLFNVWDAIEHNDPPDIAHGIITKFFAVNPPDFYDVPFSYHNQEVLRSLLNTAGFKDIQITVLPFEGTSPSAKDLSKGLIHGNPVITAIRERDESKLPEIEAALEAEVIARCGDAPVRARLQAIICTAVR